MGNKKFMILCIILSCSLLIAVIVLTYTYSFFTARVENDTDIHGTIANYNMTLDTNLISVEATGGLVPQLSDTTYLTMALSGTDGKACVDGNGHTVCQIYEITIKNSGSAPLSLSGMLMLSGVIADLKWEVLETPTTLKTNRTINTATDTVIENDFLLNGNTTKKYYIAIWLEETNRSQTKLDTDSFSGIVTFSGIGGGVMTNLE